MSQTRGMNLGRQLFDRAEEDALAAGKSYLWLDAMASADWAVRTYRAWGFKEVGRGVFDAGVRDDLAEMIVFVRDLKPR